MKSSFSTQTMFKLQPINLPYHLLEQFSNRLFKQIQFVSKSGICIFSSTEVKTSCGNLCDLIGGYTKHSQTKIEFVQTTGQAVGVVGAILIGFLHIFVSTGYPTISRKILQKCQFMQTALALQNHAKSFFPARTQSPKISNFGKIFDISENPHPLGLFGYPYFFKRKP